ncbi:MAG: hypothetical protein N3G21_00060, partial [Candidatus Hydrogenedentes bacterium]|nr:hypothetical protein [Candidatus Hydrogenedentota bacterium]
ELIKTHKIFIDTSSLMIGEQSKTCLEKILPFFEKAKVKLLIHKSVYNELLKHQAGDNKDKKLLAKNALVILTKYKSKGCLELVGKDDSVTDYADQVFIAKFTEFMRRYNLALITQDVRLAKNLYSNCIEGIVKTEKSIKILKINKDGDIVLWDFDSSIHKKVEEKNVVYIPFRDPSSFSEPITKKVKDEIIKISSYPKKDSKVRTQKFGKIQLKKEIASGGEGVVYETDQAGFICKIYRMDKITLIRKKKLELMTSKEISVDYVCWPLDTVLNEKDEFVGFIMKRGEGLPIQRCIFHKQLLARYFPQWTRIELVELCLNWLRQVDYLHKLNILIGDVNPLNFLVKSEREVYFIDTDSYQLEDFPCPVGRAEFTHPDLLGKDFKEVLRTREHELYSIAVLLFMILMPGKPPYSHQGGDEFIENIRERKFPYSFGDEDGKAYPPAGPWRYIWSHFPYKLKEAFYNCFSNFEIPTTKEWIDLLVQYKYNLQQGKLDEDPEESKKIFPSRFKHVPEDARKKYNIDDDGFMEVICASCNNSFSISTQKYFEIKKHSDEIFCHNCRDGLNQPVLAQSCRLCGTIFFIKKREYIYFKKNNLEIPRKCEACRKTSKLQMPLPQFSTSSTGSTTQKVAMSHTSRGRKKSQTSTPRKVPANQDLGCLSIVLSVIGIFILFLLLV